MCKPRMTLRSREPPEPSASLYCQWKTLPSPALFYCSSDWRVFQRPIDKLTQIIKELREIDNILAGDSISGLLELNTVNETTALSRLLILPDWYGNWQAHTPRAAKYDLRLRITYFDVKVIITSECLDFGDFIRFMQRPSIPSGIITGKQHPWCKHPTDRC